MEPNDVKGYSKGDQSSIVPLNQTSRFTHKAFSESTAASWFKDFLLKIHEKNCTEKFLQTQVNTLVPNLFSFHVQKIERKKIVVEENAATDYIDFVVEVGLQLLKHIFPLCSEETLLKMHRRNIWVIVAVVGAVEQCFRHKTLLFQVQSCYQLPTRVVEKLANENPGLADIQGLDYQEYAKLSSPWAQTIEDEIFFHDTYVYIEQLIDGDLLLAKMLILLVIFSPKEEDVTEEITSSLKQIQGQLTMAMYQHLMSKKTSNNFQVLNKLSKVVNAIERLRRASETMKSALTCPLEGAFNSFDLETIEVTPL